MMNRIIIHGRLTRDPEVREYRNSKGEPGKMASFAVAVNRSFGDGVDFFECRVFRGADTVSKWFRKGDGIVVDGSMESSKGKKNPDVTYWNLMVDRWDFAEKKNAETSGKPSSQADAEVVDSFEKIDEEVPF